MEELTEKEKEKIIKQASEMCFPILWNAFTITNAPNYIYVDFECKQGKYRMKFEKLKDE